MKGIKNFSIVEDKATGAKSIVVYYFSGIIREYFSKTLPVLVSEAISSGEFQIVKTRNSVKMYGEWYERI